MATPPSGIQLCTQNDVELAVGGVAVLAQLLDKNGDGLADSDLVTAVIAHASAEGMAAVANQYDPANLVSPYPDILVFATARLAAYYAWTMGSAEIISPEAAAALRDDALRVFDRIASRALSLGIASTVQPATNQDVKQVDTNPDGTRTTRDSTTGTLW